MPEASNATRQIIQRNWDQVRGGVADACRAASRPSDDVLIVGVSKYVDAPLTMQLVAAGCHTLGENRPQALWPKQEYAESSLAASNSAVSWHMIGHLQRNKIRRTLPLIDCLHSLDSLRLATALSEEAQRIGIQLPTLVEVNVTRDESKTGLPASALPEFLEQASALPGLALQGLMAMSSRSAGGDEARREFAAVRQLRDELTARSGGQLTLPELSMGMSGDFREAIAEGATMVRIGSILWDGVLDG